jgi:HD superfamily phosphohydrolase
MLLDYLVDEYNVDLEKDQLDLIHHLITPESSFTQSKKHPKWIFEIVANYRTSIDVDRFDYMNRDPHMVGTWSLKFDSSMFFENFKILNDQVCFSKKMFTTIPDFFNHRYKLHKTIYLNTKATSFELMMTDVLVLANKDYNFLEAIHSPSRYITLNDNILHELQTNPDPEVRTLTHRFACRDNYKFIGELNFQRNTKKKFSPQDKERISADICSEQHDDGDASQRLSPQDLCLDFFMVTYVPRSHYLGIHLYDERDRLSCINKFNY